MVKAYIARDPAGVHRIMVQRAKFKHWKELGHHKPTDRAFQRALADGSLNINKIIINTDTLFRT